MSPAFYVIRYTYPGTVDGQPVGDVYAQEIAPRVAGRSDVWSYSKDPRKVGAYVQEAAEEKIRGKAWPNVQLVPVSEVKPLP